MKEEIQLHSGPLRFPFSQEIFTKIALALLTLINELSGNACPSEQYPSLLQTFIELTFHFLLTFHKSTTYIEKFRKISVIKSWYT